MYTSTNIASQICLRLLKKFSLFLLLVSLLIYSPLSANASDQIQRNGSLYWSEGYPIDEYPPIVTDLGLPFTPVNYTYTASGYSYDSNDNLIGDQEVYVGVDYNWYGLTYEFDYNVTSYSEVEDFSVNMVLSSNWFNAYDGSNPHVQNMYIDIEDTSTGELYTFPITDEVRQSNTYYFSADIDREVAESIDIIIYIHIVFFDNQYHNFAVTSLDIEDLYTEPAADEQIKEIVEDGFYRDDSTVIDDAADKFTSEYEVLHEQENYLLEESKYIFDDFFTSFNWSALEEYLSGFQFVGTWFGNFYNSHSAVGVMVGMSAGLTILFIILRFRGH